MSITFMCFFSPLFYASMCILTKYDSSNFDYKMYSTILSRKFKELHTHPITTGIFWHKIVWLFNIGRGLDIPVHSLRAMDFSIQFGTHLTTLGDRIGLGLAPVKYTYFTVAWASNSKKLTTFFKNMFIQKRLWTKCVKCQTVIYKLNCSSTA